MRTFIVMTLLIIMAQLFAEEAPPLKSVSFMDKAMSMRSMEECDQKVFDLIKNEPVDSLTFIVIYNYLLFGQKSLDYLASINWEKHFSKSVENVKEKAIRDNYAAYDEMRKWHLDASLKRLQISKIATNIIPKNRLEKFIIHVISQWPADSCHNFWLSWPDISEDKDSFLNVKLTDRNGNSVYVRLFSWILNHSDNLAFFQVSLTPHPGMVFEYNRKLPDYDFEDFEPNKSESWYEDSIRANYYVIRDYDSKSKELYYAGDMENFKKESRNLHAVASSILKYIPADPNQPGCHRGCITSETIYGHALLMEGKDEEAERLFNLWPQEGAQFGEFDYSLSPLRGRFLLATKRKDHSKAASLFEETFKAGLESKDIHSRKFLSDALPDFASALELAGRKAEADSWRRRLAETAQPPPH